MVNYGLCVTFGSVTAYENWLFESASYIFYACYIFNYACYIEETFLQDLLEILKELKKLSVPNSERTVSYNSFWQVVSMGGVNLT